MFCPNCGNNMGDNEKFCNKCGAAVEGAAETAVTSTVPATRINMPRPLLIGLIAGLAVILVGIYVYMAWLPPTLAKSMNAMKKLQSYEQAVEISVPHNDTYALNLKTDNKQKLTSLNAEIRGERAEVYLEKNRLIIGVPSEYDQYGAVKWNDSGNNDQRTDAYLKSLQQDLEPIGEVLTKQIIKPNSDLKFNHAVVNTPGGNIKVKQYNIKMSGEQLAQATIDTSSRLSSDQVLRDHIKSAYNKSIDYMEDMIGSSIGSDARHELEDSRDELDDAINEMTEAMDESDEQSEVKDNLADFSVELQIGFDYHNRPVELIFNTYSPDGDLKVRSTCYNFNKPVNISLPSSSRIHEVGSFEDLDQLF